MRKLPPRINEERLRELVPLLKKGDKTVEKEIIEGHLRLATTIAIAKGMKKGKRKEIDDLIGEAEYAVTKAVRRVKRGALRRDDNITGYIIDYIKKHLHEVMTKKLMGVPHRTVSYWNSRLDERARHLPIKVMEIHSSEKFEGNMKNYTPPSSDKEEIDKIDMEEIIDMLPHSLLEKKLIELRKKGMTYIEIEREIGYSTSRIQQLMSEMEDQLDEILKRIS